MTVTLPVQKQTIAGDKSVTSDVSLNTCLHMLVGATIRATRFKTTAKELVLVAEAEEGEQGYLLTIKAHNHGFDVNVQHWTWSGIFDLLGLNYPTEVVASRCVEALDGGGTVEATKLVATTERVVKDKPTK